jgi:hypothetical protein
LEDVHKSRNQYSSEKP